jgi:D-proline reductase (dithiol) PrdB
VIIGSALDIVEHCGVPRFLFVDFPLGNPCGKPWDPDMQRRIVRQGLDLFATAETGRTTVYCAETWGSDEWRERYMEVNDGNRAELARKGAELMQRRANRQRRS